jgi:DNA repair protein RadC
VTAPAPDAIHRPRERLIAHGPAALGARDLIAVLLGAGGRARPAAAIADDVLVRCEGSLRRLAALPVTRLAEVPGVGEARAAALLAALELGRRRVDEGRAEGAPLRAPADVWRAFAPRLEDLPVEEFHVAILDGQHRLQRDVTVTRGLLTTSLVHPREIFREAISERAAAVVLVHNHPSGDPTPSLEDRLVTSQLVAAGRLLEIPVADHVVVGGGRYLSFAEMGIL